MKHESHEVMNTNSFSEIHKLAFDIVDNHLQDTAADKEPLCLTITGQAGTGKSYLINGYAILCKINVLLMLRQVKPLITEV